MKIKKTKNQEKLQHHESSPPLYIIPSSHSHSEPRMVSAKFLHPSVLEDVNQHNLHSHHKPLFSWIAPEYHQHPKSVAWWVWAGIFFTIAAVLEFITGNYTMLAATVTFAFVYSYLQHYHPPRHTKISISDMGIKIGHRMFPYTSIATFWIFYDPPRLKTLTIRLHEGLFPDLVIELEDQDPVEIREHLLEHIPQWENKKEQLSDIVLRIIKL